MKLVRDRSPARLIGASLLSCAAVLPLAGCDEPVGPSGAFQCTEPGVVLVDGREVPSAPGGYVVAGNKIVDVESCQPHRFVGVARPSLAYDPQDERLLSEFIDEDFRLIQSWGANTVRIEISQNFWVPTARWHDPSYPQKVDRVVRAARAVGLEVIIALQTSDRGDPQYPGDIFNTNPQQEMPDVAHSVPFWRDVATRYKDDGGILFELFSEPFYAFHGSKSNWDLWLNGGTVPAGTVYGEHRKSFQAVGMQELYNVVRETGAKNIVIIGGTHWGYYLNGVPAHRVKGYNIAYAAHPWDFSDKQPGTWYEDWAFLAETDPVMLTEIGNYDCRSGYLERVLNTADELNLSWIAWSWTVPTGSEVPGKVAPGVDPTCQTTQLILDWSGTPTWAGRLVKERLSSYSGS